MNWGQLSIDYLISDRRSKSRRLTFAEHPAVARYARFRHADLAESLRFDHVCGNDTLLASVAPISKVARKSGLRGINKLPVAASLSSPGRNM